MMWITSASRPTSTTRTSTLLRGPCAKNLVTKIVNGLQAGQGVEVFPAQSPEMLRRMLDGQAEEEVNAGLVFGPKFYEKASELTATDVLSPSGGKLQEGLKSLDIELMSDRPESSTSTVIERLVYSQTLAYVAPMVICKSGCWRCGLRKLAKNSTTRAFGPRSSLSLSKRKPARRTAGSMMNWSPAGR